MRQVVRAGQAANAHSSDVNEAARCLIHKKSSGQIDVHRNTEYQRCELYNLKSSSTCGLLKWLNKINSTLNGTKYCIKDPKIKVMFCLIFNGLMKGKVM